VVERHACETVAVAGETVESSPTPARRGDADRRVPLLPGRLLCRPVSTPAHGVWKWLPGARVVREYEWSWLPRDVVAGLVLTALLVPAGMGYAEASGLPPVTGLYATIVPLVAYAIVGPSRILVLGPDSSLAPLIAASITPLAAGNPDAAIALAGMLSILAGAFCIAAGLARFGFITDLLSKPVRYGYMNGIALVVIVSQLPKLFGFSVDADGVIEGGREFVRGVGDGETNPTALAIGAVSLALILAFKRWMRRVPGVLVCVVGATVVVGLFDLAARRDVAVVGELPRGLPSFSVPEVAPGDLLELAAGAVGIALVSFADTSVLSRTFALRRGDDVDPDQEMIALGAANVASGLFRGFPVSSSASRTPVAEQAGSQSQLTGLVGAGAIALMLVAAPGLVRNLPQSTLAAVVITAALGLFEVTGVRRLWRMRRREFALSIVCFLGVAVLGVIEGILIAVGLALANFIQRAWRPYDAVLGRIDGMKGYHDVRRNPHARQVSGLLLYRWDAPLFFANADVFEERLLRAIADASTPIRRVVVTAEPMTDVDTSAADVLERIHHELVADGIELAFAEMKSPVMDQLERYGLLELLGRDSFFPTIGTAVKDYVGESGVEWVDWEDAAVAADKRRPPSAQ
jgi:high affinity sulfate transporter 1